MTQDPIMYVFAGNNGSGKSTIRSMFYDYLGSAINVDPDALLQKHQNRTSKNPSLSAGKEALQIVNDCIHTRQDFSMETTLASKTSIRQIKQAKDQGFSIVVIYVGTNDVAINLIRITQRVENGGHDIPKEDVLRRHYLSRENLLSNLYLIDTLMLVDNSGKNGEHYATIEKGQVIEHIYPLVAWGDELINQIKQ